ncbi:conserved hypothetical protein [Trichinella spiralis]|uniref:hypothetical protein n=1 Tax=Trichinella spiralis TaxID=6334 RepID=UPI0001EFC20C|nr:conserved hypothetical protein [Trichinella spiralis]
MARMNDQQDERMNEEQTHMNPQKFTNCHYARSRKSPAFGTAMTPFSGNGDQKYGCDWKKKFRIDIPQFEENAIQKETVIQNHGILTKATVWLLKQETSSTQTKL